MSFCHHFASVVHLPASIHLSSIVGLSDVVNLSVKLFSSGTTELFWTILGSNGSCVVQLQKMFGNLRLPRCLLLLKIEKWVVYFKNLFVWNFWAKCKQTVVKWSLGGPPSKLCPTTWRLTKMTAIAELYIVLHRILWEIIWKCSFLKLQQKQMQPTFDGKVLRCSSTKILSGIPVYQLRCPPQPNLSDSFVQVYISLTEVLRLWNEALETLNFNYD